MPDTPFPDLSDQIAVVTGGGRGIGRVVATHLAQCGAAVCLIGRDETALAATAHTILDAGGRAAFSVADVRRRKDVETAVQACVDGLGTPTLLVNNAGTCDGAGPLTDVDPDLWWRDVEVNLKGPFLFTRAVLPHMLAAGAGRIINMGSFSANLPSPRMSSYATSKAALYRLTDSTALETDGTGVCAFIVSPGWVWTDMTERADNDLRQNDPNWAGMDPAFIFPPEAVSELILRLASGEADTLSGRMIHVRDDLDALLEDAGDIVARDRHVLRYRD